MSDKKDVAVVNSGMSSSYFPTDSDWRMLLDVGTKAVRSGMLPTAIKTPEAAAIIALKARELGMPIMVGFSHIHVINGKPTLSAEMLQALARKNLPGLVINIIESTNEKASVEFIRPESGSRPYKITFTIEDAKKAELLKNPTWTKYPAAMLWSRAVSAGLRKVCPEALIGVSYTPEELGAQVDEEGNVIETNGRHVSEEMPDTPPPTPPVSEKLKLQKQMVDLMKEKGIPTQEIKSYLLEEFKVESSKFLTETNLKQVIGWMDAWEPAAAEWENEADQVDPRIVK